MARSISAQLTEPGRDRCSARQSSPASACTLSPWWEIDGTIIRDISTFMNVRMLLTVLISRFVRTTRRLQNYSAADELGSTGPWPLCRIQRRILLRMQKIRGRCAPRYGTGVPRKAITSAALGTRVPELARPFLYILHGAGSANVGGPILGQARLESFLVACTTLTMSSHHTPTVNSLHAIQSGAGPAPSAAGPKGAATCLSTEAAPGFTHFRRSLTLARRSPLAPYRLRRLPVFWKRKASPQHAR